MNNNVQQINIDQINTMINVLKARRQNIIEQYMRIIQITSGYAGGNLFGSFAENSSRIREQINNIIPRLDEIIFSYETLLKQMMLRRLELDLQQAQEIRSFNENSRPKGQGMPSPTSNQVGSQMNPMAQNRANYPEVNKPQYIEPANVRGNENPEIGLSNTESPVQTDVSTPIMSNSYESGPIEGGSEGPINSDNGGSDIPSLDSMEQANIDAVSELFN